MAADSLIPRLQWVFLIILSSISLSASVDKGNFKTCEQSSFCRRNRAIKSGESTYTVLKESVVFTDNTIEANILNTRNNITLQLQLFTLEKNTARFKINEINPIRPRYEVKDSLVSEPKSVRYQQVQQDDSGVHISFNHASSIVLTYEPFRLDFMVENQVAVSVNSKGLMNFEHYREKINSKPNHEEAQAPAPPGPESIDSEEKSEDGQKKEEENKEENKEEEGMWEEQFKDHHDSKPRGPSSVGMDISFPGIEHVYGIPEHADTLALKNTIGAEPYRLYNLDVFEYELDSRMALYGSIPVMVAHSVSKTVGVFWMNAAETWVDITTADARKSMLNSLMSFFKAEEEVPQVETHWFSESGIIDVFVMLGPKPHDVFKQYATLTGTTSLPPLFGISYHQCRWNYNDEEDVKNVDAGFDDHDIPYDVLWLDIEHTDGKKYMTWDSVKFPTPDIMQNNLAAKGRKMVTIVDPHIKRESGYHIHEEASRLGLYIKNKDGGQYENWCWPGQSSWIDFTNPEYRDWWSDQFALDKYKGSTNSLFIWNDMNEYWYHLDTNKIYRGANNVQVEAQLDKIPVFQRGGSIIPRKNRVRRCSSLTRDDPYTLTMALDTKGEAEGDLYIDDGHTFAYKNGAFAYMKFSFKRGKLTAQNVKPNTSFDTKAWIERIVVLGISNSPKSIVLQAGGQNKELQFTHDSKNFILTVKKPAVNAVSEWTMAMYA